MVITVIGLYSNIYNLVIGLEKSLRRYDMENRGYEYEMSIPKVETGNIRIDNLSLSSSSGVMSDNTMTVCGVMLFAITMKREIKSGQTVTKYAKYSL